MKKNLMSVLILALVLANLILTVILMISVVPQSKKANELITKVCNAIDLQLDSGKEDGSVNVPMDQLEEVKIADGETMTINLKKGEDGKDHWAVISFALAVDTKHKDYKKYGIEAITEKQGLIKDEMNKIVANHTMEELRDNAAGVQGEILKKLQKMFDSDYIVSVAFDTINYQ